VAQELRQAGWNKARALIGGWKAWQEAKLPVEPRTIESEAETAK
jgi:3-mercaptopyruvate sulfurtransferase SseA